MAASSTTSTSVRRSAILLVALLPAAALADFETGGHLKWTVTGQSWPSDSLFRDIVGASSVDQQGEFRLNLDWRRGAWDIDVASQLVALQGDSVGVTTAILPGGAPPGALPEDDRRLLDLTAVPGSGGDSAILLRLDRLAVTYTSEKAVLRLGRQALSWGNGFFYTPMDLVNPFDPAAIDTEYKAGDDMMYLQFLRDNGDDLQAAVVGRRDPVSGSILADESTAAVKYHGFAGDLEYDILVAESYGETVVGLGILQSLGGANWQADVVVTDGADDTEIEFVTNLAYSWTWGGKNVSGVLEYYFNGFGQRDGQLDTQAIVANTALAGRLARGRTFAVGRHYLAGSVSVEMTPLWTITPVLLGNVDDPSALLQLTTTYSLADDVSLLGSLNLPIGAGGTEFGGIETATPGTRLSTGPGVFAQLAWYF